MSEKPTTGSNRPAPTGAAAPTASSSATPTPPSGPKAQQPSATPPPVAPQQAGPSALSAGPVATGAATTATATPAPPVPAPIPVSGEELDRLVGGAHYDPHSILGAHRSEHGWTIRALRPWAESVAAVIGDQRHPLHHEHEGVWVTLLADADEAPDYRLEITYPGAGPQRSDDPYRYLPTLGEVDLHLIGEGRHEQLWEVLGSRLRRYNSATGEIQGTSFAVWAPNARGIRVVGSFNHWEGTAFPMRSLGSSGVWELFIPDIGAGTVYKYEILGVDSVWRQKADPMAFATEIPPATGSVVTESDYTWNDQEWLSTRSQVQPLAAPMSTYEVHLGSWRPNLSYLQLADELVAYVTDLGFTHVELLPVAEHPFGGSWGYQVSSYFAPSARFGTPDEFRHLVDRLHQAGIGVVVDWVPAHFPKDEWALARFDGTPLYEPADPRRGEHPDWGTLVFDYGRNEVRNFLVANAVYWCEQYHIDGLRVDAVASMLYLDYSRKAGEWLPNQYGGRENLEAVSFLQEMNATVYRRCPGAITIAEESTDWPAVTKPTYLGGLGFGFKWNMGWMHDTLDYMSREPIYRQYHHHQMTFSMMYAYSENFILPISHDEVVHGKGSLLHKMPGDRWQQLANVRALLAYMWAHPGKQLLFMGSEFGQDAEWSESHGLDWWLLDYAEHRGVQKLVRDLNTVYAQTRALWSQDADPQGFGWIDANDAGNNAFSFLRWGDDGSALACITNFSARPLEGYRVGLPYGGDWREVINTDASAYGGSGVGNMGGVHASDEGWHGQTASVTLRVPPLGAVWLHRPAD